MRLNRLVQSPLCVASDSLRVRGVIWHRGHTLSVDYGRSCWVTYPHRTFPFARVACRWQVGGTPAGVFCLLPYKRYLPFFFLTQKVTHCQGMTRSPGGDPS